MGLLDILNGMMYGPRGQRQPGSGGSGSGGMSPIMIALLGLLAYKALKGRGGQGPNPGATDRPVAPALRAEGLAISSVDCWAGSPLAHPALSPAPA
jgi:hypothetical protein